MTRATRTCDLCDAPEPLRVRTGHPPERDELPTLNLCPSCARTLYPKAVDRIDQATNKAEARP